MVEVMTNPITYEEILNDQRKEGHDRKPPVRYIVTKYLEEVYVERLCKPPRKEGSKTILSDVLCRVYPTEATEEEAYTTAEQNAHRIVNSLEFISVW